MSEVTAMFLAGEIDAEDFNIEILRIAAVGN